MECLLLGLLACAIVLVAVGIFVDGPDERATQRPEKSKPHVLDQELAHASEEYLRDLEMWITKKGS